MTKNNIYDLHAEICKVMGHPIRILIIDLLKNKELCFSELQEETGLIKSTLSQHLSAMINKGILKVRKDNRCNHYKLSSQKVARAFQMIREVLIDNHNISKTIFEKQLF